MVKILKSIFGISALVHKGHLCRILSSVETDVDDFVVRLELFQESFLHDYCQQSHGDNHEEPGNRRHCCDKRCAGLAVSWEDIETKQIIENISSIKSPGGIFFYSASGLD